MLVLSRKQGDRVTIPEVGVTLIVLEIRGERIRFGIEADQEVSVLRRDVPGTTPGHVALSRLSISEPVRGTR